jgi:hypothetical protein
MLTFLDTTIFEGERFNSNVHLDSKVYFNQQIHINYCTKTRSIPNYLFWYTQVATTTISQDMQQ